MLYIIFSRNWVQIEREIRSGPSILYTCSQVLKFRGFFPDFLGPSLES